MRLRFNLVAVVWSAQACLRLVLRQLAAARNRQSIASDLISPKSVWRSKLRQTKAVASYRTPRTRLLERACLLLVKRISSGDTAQLDGDGARMRNQPFSQSGILAQRSSK